MEVQFYDEIEFETIQFEVARDVVFYSFIVQQSLTYLDLSTCEYTLHQKSVFTEEQCRKMIEPRRQILYSFNLDLPRNLESSLRAVIPNADDQEQFEAFHLGVMYVCGCLYSRDLASCVIETIMSARDKIDKLRRYLNVMILLNFNQCRTTAMFLFDHLILALYPYCSDSYLVVEFAITFRFCSWIFHRETPILVGYILHHAFQIRYNFWQLLSESGLDPINGCILFGTPENITTLLQYGNVLCFQPGRYLSVLGRPWEQRIMRRIIRKNIPDRRVFLILQFFYFYRSNKRSWEGLLYIWRSIPDPFIRNNEIDSVFGNYISSRMLHNMIAYYKCYIIEEKNEFPRPLQHLCRVAVRSALIRNRQLPYGISQLGVPRLIRDYLNLKC